MVPKEDHRFCWRHLYQNFKKLFNSKGLKDIMWNAAKAITASDFTKIMEKMKEKDDSAYNWLMSLDRYHWCTHAFSSRLKCNKLLNNISESFNSTIKDSREKPILTLLKEVITYNMNLIQKNRDLIMKYGGPIIPKAQSRIEKEKLNSQL